VRNIDDTLLCDEFSAGDKDYTQSEHVRKINCNDSDQNDSANDVPADPTYMALKTGDLHFCKFPSA
jgi:hypothetical protein